MAETHYHRRETTDSIVYEIGSAPNSSGSTEKAMAYIVWGVGAVFLGWLVAIPLMVVTMILHLPSAIAVVGGIILAFLLIKKWREGKLNKRVAGAMGRRGKSTITLTRSTIRGHLEPQFGSDREFDVPLEDVRRFRLTNTLHDTPNTKLTSSNSAALGMALAQPTAGRAGVLMASHEIGRMRAEKAATACYAVMIDYQNSSVALADGLDQLTARNIIEDVERDVRRYAIAA